ncbi:AAA family ATPase [Methanocalculus taiwanensis]|uniref:AAA family ATPase n=1 Tax=Methanocalculus taiwanensis TaxID=106207 RepID=A0ABD4TH62_9EURY|nr:AAA family ATPase [Methanocalculus taiwanensis]MCQ1538288.1 AAA family ATPase [Methanocalculus taiwanensis]
MKISSLFIDGFGVFNKWKPPEEFGDGLTAVIGENEAGKTTLLSFIRRMLYGFPGGKKQKINHYQPVNGGTIGGRLEILSDDGRAYHLSRSGVRGEPSVTLADGTALSGSTLPSLLGPGNQVFYENVCAIGLDELQQFSTLDQDEIRDRLAAAGAGNLPMRKVASFLDESADKIYAVKGRTKRLNELMSGIKKLDQDIRVAKKQQSDYDRIADELARLTGVCLEEQERKQGFSGEIEYYKALSQGWEPFSERKDALDQIRDIPETGSFPGDALSQLSRMQEEISRLAEVCRDLRESIGTTDQQYRSCEVRDEILAEKDAIHEIERNIEWYRSQVAASGDIANKRTQEEQRLNEKLRYLGEGWDEERISLFDTSVPVRDEADTIRERLRSSERASDKAQSEVSVAEQAVTEKEGSVRSLQKRRTEIGDVPDMDTAGRRLSNARELNRSIQELFGHEQRIQAIQQEEARRDEILSAFSRPEEPGTPSWPGILVLLAAVLSIAGGVLMDALLLGGIIGLILIIAAAGLLLSMRKGDEEKNTFTEAGSYRAEIKRLAEQRQDAEAERDQIRQKVQQLVDALGLKGTITRTAAEECLHASEDLLRKAEKAAAIDLDIEEAISHLQAADDVLKKAQKQLAYAHKERSAALKIWQAWCIARDLSPDMNPDRMPDLFNEIEAAAHAYARIRGYIAEEEGVAANIERFQEKVSAVVAACGEEMNGPHDFVAEDLARMLDEEEALDRTRASLKATLEMQRTKLEKETGRLAEADEKLNTFLSEGGAETADEYRTHVAQSVERERLLEIIQNAESTIRRISGDERYDGFMIALEKYDPLSMEVQREEKQEIVKHIEESIGSINQEIGQLNAAKKQIEEDHNLPLLLSQQAALVEELQSVSRQWAVYTVASHLLNQAVSTFERERQPQIVREAQSFFSRFTGGRYTRIITPLDGGEIYVEEANGTRKTLPQLSRGTAEQLYLALRFGYIRDYATSSVPVPIIFDDILVNFDPARRKNACDAIADLAETCQVLYFTCHPETVRDLTEAVPGAVVMGLGR